MKVKYKAVIYLMSYAVFIFTGCMGSKPSETEEIVAEDFGTMTERKDAEVEDFITGETIAQETEQKDERILRFDKPSLLPANSWQWWSGSDFCFEKMPLFFNQEELIEFCDNFFLSVTCYREHLLDGCWNKLTPESIEKIETFEWPDIELYQQLDWAKTQLKEVQEGICIYGTTKLEAKYTGYSFEQYYEVEYSWKLEDHEGALFEIEDIRLRETEETGLISLEDRHPCMTSKELSAYTKKLFIILVREPDKIEEYKDVFDAESVELWKGTEWFYLNPEEVYNDGNSGCGYETGQIGGYTVVHAYDPGGIRDFSEFEMNPAILDRKEVRERIDILLPEEDRDTSSTFQWLIQIDWDYDEKTGIITVSDMCIAACI